MPDANAAASTPQVNIAHRLKLTTKRMPSKRAVVQTAGHDRQGRIAYSHLTFAQLDRASDRLALGLEHSGIVRGTKTVLMVKPGIDFFVLIFALFKVGAVPVVVDPGMGMQRMLRCLESTTPRAFIGISAAHVVRALFPRFFRSVKIAVTAGRRLFWGGTTLAHLSRHPWQPYAPAPTHRDETAAILFTTGSTGPAKGAVYTHGNFDAQIQQIQDHFAIGEDEIDLPTFPLFALFDPALGMTAVIPDMDPRKPALVDPEKIIGPIRHHGVTNMFASPALLDRVGRFGRQNRIRLPSLRRVVSAGAPVSPANIAQFATMLSADAQIHTPYGATEAVPIISIGSHEILSETRALSEQGHGMCVGRPLPHTRIRIIRIADDPIPVWEDGLEVRPGEIGEIIVQGELVTRRYYRQPRADALAKIRDGDRFWHRMGDLGWQDKKGRIWFCGRKSHRVITSDGDMYTIPCEAIFNNHPQVFRSALVGIGTPPHQEPVICIELHADQATGDTENLERALGELAAGNPLTAPIRRILFHPSFPVDIRHNAKIFREKLARWAETQIRGR
ncbi:MAG: fatty acid CoA ligase family protein [Desulfobacterales bacterium]|jgi:acyl-CoA synthetase (AMP-forming)/AMP-acid ligase II